MRRLTNLMTLATATWLVAGCSDRPGPVELDEPIPLTGSLSVSDGANGGNDHFFWLPPLVSNPSPSGTFDGTQSPQLSICELAGNDCAAAQPSGMPLVYTLTSGPDGETITVSADHYKANWHTDVVELDDTKFYRLEVTVGLQPLGHVDIDPVDKGKDLKNVDTNEYIGLVNGRTLPVKFRIEDGALDLVGPVTTDVAGAANPAPVGVDIVLTAEVDDSGTGGSDIASAEYNVDGGAYTAMTAQDGTFDSPSETVEATIAGLASPGDRTVCVRGTDAVGNTGAESCTTISVEGFAWAQVSVGGNHACGVSTDGTPYCWGFGNTGQLGNGSNLSQDVPTLVSGGLTVASIDAGGDGRSCAITTSGDAYCWGVDENGELGRGVTGGTEFTPVPVVGGHTFAQIGNAGRNTCALDTAGAAYCWGSNAGGRVGDGTFVDTNVPTPVVGGLTFSSLAVGGGTCGLTTADVPYCWGGNVRSELGIGTTGGYYNTPQAVAGAHTFTEIVKWGVPGCGREPGGSVYCWGVNWTGALGFDPIDYPGTTGEPTPILAANVPTNLTSLAAGDFFMCGLDGSGTALCWGQNRNGTLGVDPATTTQTCVDFAVTGDTCSSTPVSVSGGHSFVQLDAGTNNACGLTADGAIWCWGWGGLGALGDGSGFASVFSFTPVEVVDPM